MRVSASIAFSMFAGFLMGCTTTDGNADQLSDNKVRCAGFGFEEGTDAFANCTMKLSMRQQGQLPPDHDTLVRRYVDRSMARRGDDRYPVCSASDMDAELDISSGKWVGPNCQMAPD
ncbi:hypothetical protein [Neorhizobium sp. DT-125]|uniref:hypothetical protein n=1 Tax=Neorhizobium sp. DT-125 TaxID=3396163 RepID=UPI003F19B791